MVNIIVMIFDLKLKIAIFSRNQIKSNRNRDFCAPPKRFCPL